MFFLGAGGLLFYNVSCMIQLTSACGILDFSISCDQSVCVPDQKSGMVLPTLPINKA